MYNSVLVCTYINYVRLCTCCSTDRYARFLQGLAMGLIEILSYQILSVSVG